MSEFSLGIDIGGTFTDIACHNLSDDTWKYGKVLTTYPDFDRGVAEAIRRFGIDLARTKRLVHGTTVVTNTVIEGKGSRTGLVTTAGFADILEIARSDKAEPHGHLQDKFGPGRPTHLVPRRLRLEVDERTAHDGRIVRELDRRTVSGAIRTFKKESVDVVAVSLINSYANPAHEEDIREVFRSEYPEALVHLSSEVSPVVREYERTSTVVVNAYVSRVIGKYLSDLVARLREMGYRGHDLSVMTSSGGVIDSRAATSKPVVLVESGPSAGVIAARALGAALGLRNVVSFDMGGTTAKAALIENGNFSLSTQYKVGALSGHTIGKGSQGGGYPINIVVMDIAEAGAGGGSIAWVDAGLALHVGPESAGSSPGPACYGFGGTNPTVTDANLILGRINPTQLAGGSLPLCREPAEEAVSRGIAKRLGLDPVEAAMGIVEIVNTNMVKVMRVVSLERGYDPRDYCMIAFGSAAPQHAAWLADELQMPAAIIPGDPGCFSAKGLVLAQPSRDIVQTYVTSLSELDVKDLTRTVGRMKGLAAHDFAGAREGRTLVWFDMRYPKQGWEISVPLGGSWQRDSNLPSTIGREFARLHERMYGYHFDKIVPLIVGLRLRVVQRKGDVAFRSAPAGRSQRPSRDSELGERDVFFVRGGEGVTTTIYDRTKLLRGNLIRGPALIEEPQSTTVVPPGHDCRVDRAGNLVITIEKQMGTRG